MPLLRALLIGELDARPIGDALRGWGYDPVFAQVESPAELIETLDSTFDVALLDSEAAGCGVPLVTRLLRERDLDLPVLLLSPTLSTCFTCQRRPTY